MRKSPHQGNHFLNAKINCELILGMRIKYNFLELVVGVVSS